jgi:hypothetical protein
MTDLRKLVDITPWDKQGSSFWGLKRDQAKKVATVFIIFGIFFAIPAIFPDPTDLLTLWLANKITDKFSLGLIEAMALINVSGIVLFFIGIYIYPYNTRSLFNGYMNKMKRKLKQMLRNPKYIAISLCVLIVLWKVYSKQI